MKKIVGGNLLKEKMINAINILCNTVKTTLGPKGSNAIIDHSTFSPFITNDGVTIALNIESEDEVLNTIFSLAKEASIKTNETVGDGTTTTLVYLQSLFNEGMKLINEGENAIILKDLLYKSLDNVIKELQKYSKIPSKEELLNIAEVSSNDYEIGKIVSEVYLKILNKDAIIIKEGSDILTKINYLKGYVIESNIPSPYFLNKEKEIKLDNAKVLIIDNHLEEIEDIANIINYILMTKDNLVIIANSYNEYFIEQIINYNIDNNTHIILLSSPLYGINKMAVLNDIKAFSNAKIINNPNNIQVDDLGSVINITINNEVVVFNFKFNNELKMHILELNNLLSKDNVDKNFISKRLTMFEHGSATIEVGGLTKIERREKKMRYDDALWAISEASKGVLPGSGIIPYLISLKLDCKDNGDKLIKKALTEPLKTILNNAGLKNEDIIKEIENNDYKILYNVKTNKYEKIDNTKILDPTSVEIESISNAISIAALLLTTDNLIINEYQNNLNKINEYNDIYVKSI